MMFDVLLFLKKLTRNVFLKRLNMLDRQGTSVAVT